MPLAFRQPEGRRIWAKALLEPIGEVRWADLARELFAWQFERVPAYRRLYVAKGISPAALKSWKQIPAVPQQLFKRDRLWPLGGKLSPSAWFFSAKLRVVVGYSSSDHRLA